MNRFYLSIHMTEDKLILCEGIVSKRVYPDINYVYLARMNYDDILELVKAVPEFTIVQLGQQQIHSDISTQNQ